MSRLIFTILACSFLLIGCQHFRNAPSDTAHTAFSGPSTNSDSQIRKLRPGVWIHISHHKFPSGARYPSNGLIVREGDSLLLVDPAWGAAATRVLLRRIEQEIGLPVRRAIITHFHDDRTDGLEVLEHAGVEVLATPLTQKLSTMDGGPVSDGTLSGLNTPGATIQVGTVEVLYPGPAHSPDNLMVWLPEQRVLFGGCAVRAIDWKTLGNLEDADLASWPEAIRRAQAHYPNVKIVVPGHGDVGGREILEHTLRLL
ncbi:subclass B1 metallo-beta-lactamase [Salinisphaera sp.]|uniref:subclass B1 metallo-beta-lactamase n=1 Tax=Salinisphaera sp. TaxID=1914330 RepID=UPI002D792366|nr:subclass B1 metallo-beta-lactamase [Salinisphaera sp.]HET7315399.1 subclass B1 metallo-beta-lactamase [Salinisphaera sp.]